MVPFTGKREDALVRHGRWRDEGRERLHEWEEGTGGLVKNYGPGRWLDLFKKKARPIFHACGFRPPMGCSANKNSLRSPHY